MEPFGVYSDSRIRNSVSHSMRTKDGWDKIVISKHHTQERKGIGTPGVGSYVITSRQSRDSRSLVMRASCSARSPSPSSRSWLPFHSLQQRPNGQPLKIVGVSFPKAQRKLGHSPTYLCASLPSPVESARQPSPNSSRPRSLHVLPSLQKSSPVSGLYMPVFARHSRSMSFCRATRQSPRSMSPRFSPWSSDSSYPSLFTSRGRGAPKFGSPRTRPRLDFRLISSCE